ncbi:uncharacterized protein LOC121374586 [Gigantopelta aegis]|uniref:uncharacterized protein LOC121374586 n=1 Tax=Gigantopelta aegis TaxID=1735272 RepID=UPI001B88889E|nr:uncharacterized protein LOC121374586 [Gigantopelta aegis]
MKSTTLNVKKSRKTWPRFLVIGSSDDEALKKLSPFAIQKGLEGLAGEPKSVKKLTSGSLLVECSTENHSRNLLKSKHLCNISIKVSPHTSLNSCKRVVRSRDLEGVSEDEICENLSSQGVTSVKRMNVRRNNELVSTNTLILTFNMPFFPNSVKAGYLNIPVVPYIPNPLRCFKCQKFGHGQNTCRNKLTCARCGQFDHDSKVCQNDIACTNCKGKHFAYSRECPKWKVEKEVQHVKVEKHLSFTEARKVVEASTPSAAGKSYAAAAKVSTTSIAIQTDLTWPNGEDKFKKISNIEKVQKQTTKAANKHVSKASQVTLDSTNPSRGSSSEEPGPSKPTPRKDLKKHNKDSSSGRLKKYEKQLVPTNNPFEALSDVDDQMDIVPDDCPQSQRSRKPKITPVLPPND